MDTNAELLVCDCTSVEHQITIFHDYEFGAVILTVHLKKFRFWQRLWHGIKYIFGHKSVYGDFDEFIFNKSHVEALKGIIKEIETAENYDNA